MEYEHILFEQRDRVAIVTLNRPDRLNAWGAQMNNEVRDAITQSNANPAIGAIVMTGAGRAYCSGADLSGPIGGGDGAAKPAPAAPTDTWLDFLAKNPKPIVAAMNGAAVGIGVTHTLPFDIRIGTEFARVGFTFAKVGLVPELGSSYFLPQIVGYGRALEWCVTARLVPPAEALDAGLFTEIVAPDALLDRAVELASQAALQAPPAIALIKRLFRQNASETDFDAVFAREVDALAAVRGTWESKEAMAAFMEKRAPDYAKEAPSVV